MMAVGLTCVDYQSKGEVMDLYAEREGNVKCAHVTFDACHGMRLTVRRQDGEAVVEIAGASEPPLVVCDGLPLTITVYSQPEASTDANRYRWLRITKYQNTSFWRDLIDLRGPEMDAAIDAAIADDTSPSPTQPPAPA